MESVPYKAVQVIVSVIPIVGIVMGAVVIFFYLLWNHRQAIKIIETGAYKKNEFDLDVFSLLAGLLLSGIGASLVTFFIIKDGFSYGVLSGLIPLSIGVSFIVFFILRMKFFRQ